MSNMNFASALEDAIGMNGFIIYDFNSEPVLRKLMERIKNYDKDVKVLTCVDTGLDCSFVQCISRKKMEVLKKQFFLYEFTDQGICLDENYIFPSVLNYVQQGILNEDELVDALLYKIG